MAKRMITLAEKALRLIYPAVCPLCGDILTRRQQEKLKEQGKNPFICPECAGLLDFAPERRCMKCSRPLETEEDDLCSDCRTKKRHFENGFAMLRHNDEARKIIYDLKYSNLRDNADFLAWELARRAGRLIAMWQPDAFIPVPLHRARARERGFNQSELIARALSERLKIIEGIDIPVDNDYIIRNKKTAPQKGLAPDERKGNIAGAFSLSPGSATARYRTVVIIDDIFTTGATVNEMAKILRKSGVSVIYFVTCSIVG